VLYGFQHLLLLLATTVLAPLLLARGIHATPEITALLITGTLFASGIATMLQGLGILRVGARLPVVQGTELYFIPPLIAIGLNNGLGSIAFCVALGGFLIAVGSRYFKYISRLFPKLVIGTIITLIGVYLIPIGIDQFLGKNTPFFGTYKAFLVGSITFFITILGGFVFKGIWNSLSVLLGILSGYIVALFMGMVEFSAVEKASWFSLPHLFPFGLQIPNISSIILVIVLFIIAAIETTGYISATSELVGVQPTDKRVSRGLAADGIGSLISGLLGSIPMTAYAQNLGAIGITKVGSRYIAIYAGAITLLLGVVPKFGAAVSTIPAPVIGGALLILFGTIAGIGIQTLRPVLNTQRNLLIFATSLSLGVGFALAPDAGLEFMSSGGQVALQTGVAIGALAAIVLNLITPKQSDW
jgi:NCS2 family nucleobase:cation symporter-2